MKCFIYEYSSRSSRFLQIWQLNFKYRETCEISWISYSVDADYFIINDTFYLIDFSPATSRRLIHTDVAFPKYDDSERSKAASDSTKPARDTEDYRRLTAQGLLFGGQIIPISLKFYNRF